MKSFLKNILYFLFFAITISICFALGYAFKNKISFKDLPAPDISDSYSLNEKMDFIRKKNKQADILTIGSSMSLNNLDAKTIVHEMNSESYLNLSSWGMSMNDVYHLLKVQSEIHMPKTLIIASSVLDFQMSEKNVKYDALKSYLLSSDYEQMIYHIRFFNLKYYIDNFKYAKAVRSIANNYEYLEFDKYGAVNLDGDNFKIDTSRWYKDYLKASNFLPQQYSYLDSISAFCERSKIMLLFLQSPYRTKLYSSLMDDKREVLKAHISKVESTVVSHHHVFIDANKGEWEDSLFIDGTHFNRLGAKRFTEYCFRILKDEGTMAKH